LAPSAHNQHLHAGTTDMGIGATAITRIDPPIDLLTTIDPHMPTLAGDTVHGGCGAGDGVGGSSQCKWKHRLDTGRALGLELVSANACNWDPRFASEDVRHVI